MKKYILYIALTITAINFSHSQSGNNWDYLLIREDVVLPSQTYLYEATLNSMVSMLNKNKVKDLEVYTHLQDNYIYSHIKPITSIDDVEKGLVRQYFKGQDSLNYAYLQKDMYDLMENYRYYIVKYMPKMSYSPADDKHVDEHYYRKWNYYHFLPGTENEVESILNAWSYLYKQKNIKKGFRVYKGVIGMDNPVYIFTTWGDDPRDYQDNLIDIMNSLGVEGSELWGSMMQYVRKVETVEGWYLPQFSYISK